MINSRTTALENFSVEEKLLSLIVDIELSNGLDFVSTADIKRLSGTLQNEIALRAKGMSNVIAQFE